MIKVVLLRHRGKYAETIVKCTKPPLLLFQLVRRDTPHGRKTGQPARAKLPRTQVLELPETSHAAEAGVDVEVIVELEPP
jgi:hypothetical protein